MENKKEKKPKMAKKQIKIKKLEQKKTILDLKIIELNDFLTKKTYYVGFLGDKAVTKKYNTKSSLLEKNPRFKKSFNNSTLKVVKIDSKNGGIRNYV